MIITIASVLIGALITWGVTLYYYKRAAEDLSHEAQKLREMTALMLRGMEEAGWAEFSKDNRGRPQGLVIHASAQMTSSSGITADAEVD